VTNRVDLLIEVVQRDLESRGWNRTSIDAYLVGYLGKFLQQAVNSCPTIQEEVEWTIRSRSRDIRGTLDAGGLMGQPG